ncbi:MAG: conjugative transfer system coupling protein TraD [Betaproteobacteria bacterium]|nr:conjugative transfer system coupling protein TraD [Betaproteobacteria bacterium]
MSNSFSMPFRPNFEASSALGWVAAIIALVVSGLVFKLPTSYIVTIAVVCTTALAIRGYAAYRLAKFFVDLAGEPFQKITFEELDEITKGREQEFWLGKGFTWTPEHTRYSVELLQRDFQQVLPPAWFSKMLGKAVSSPEFVGQPWIHGVGAATERDIRVAMKHLEGNTCVVGMPGSGKTTLYRLHAYQVVKRGDCLIVLDPKNDRELKNAIQEACVRAGRPDRFIAFDPAHPQSSVRYDALANWSRETEPASRITDVVTAMTGGADSFTSYSWSVLQSLADGMIYVGKRPTLKLFRALIENGPEQLMEEVLGKFFAEYYGTNWMSRCSAYIELARTGKIKTQINGSPELIGMVQAYKLVPIAERPTQLNGLLDTVEHNREHLGKMLTTLKPALTALTSGDLGALLSPDASDADDLRPIFDSAKIVEGGYVAYIGLDSLTDDKVAAAMATLILADFKAVAGNRYNYADKDTLRSRIELIIDEANEIMGGASLVQLLNKSRGSGMRIWISMQSFADIVTKMGSAHHMEQVLDNTVNMIALRTKGNTTTKEVVRMLGRTSIAQTSQSINAGTRSDDAGLHITGGEGKSTSQKETQLFPEELLSRLPNFEYVAALAGGNVVKGRFPLLM